MEFDSGGGEYPPATGAPHAGGYHTQTVVVPAPDGVSEGAVFCTLAEFEALLQHERYRSQLLDILAAPDDLRHYPFNLAVVDLLDAVPQAAPAFFAHPVWMLASLEGLLRELQERLVQGIGVSGGRGGEGGTRERICGRLCC